MPAVWFEVTVDVPKEDSDTVANVLIENGSPGLRCDERDERVALVAYFPVAPAVDDLRRRCAAAGVPLPGTSIRMREIAEENWADNWKLHFQPQCIGERLYVCPPWDAIPPPGRLA